MNKIYIGIDPGAKGGIVVMDGNKINKYAMPSIDKEIDKQGIKNIFKIYKPQILLRKVHAVLEDVHSIFGVGAKSNFQFGRALGIVEGALEALEIPYTMVGPKTWQKELWQGIKLVEKNTGKETAAGNAKFKTDTKSTSLKAAKRLFPKESLLATERSKVPHDGIVDALLIAEYCRRKFN